MLLKNSEVTIQGDVQWATRSQAPNTDALMVAPGEATRSAAWANGPFPP